MTPGAGSRGPGVLLVLPEHWPRTLLRAELIERGYDPVGTPDLRTAIRLPPARPDREPTGLIVVDQAAAGEADRWLLDLLVAKQGGPPVLLLAPAGAGVQAGPWQRVLRRPVPIGEIVAAVEEMLPRKGAGVRAGPEPGSA